MKRIIFTILTLAMSLGMVADALAWGREGHATVAYIAEMNLTPRAKANVEKCIGGHSIVYYASWLDSHRAEHKVWNKRRHTFDFDNETFKPIGKPIAQMRESIALLSDYENLTDSARRFNIYALVHTMGDFHCPGHIEFRTSDGKTKVRGSFYDVHYLAEKKPHGYHHIWDVLAITGNHSDWGYMDYGHILCDGISQERRDAILAGTLEEWFEDNARRCNIVYEKVPAKPEGTPFEELSVVDRDILNSFGDLASEQLLRGGLRLAKVLNDLFDK